MKKDNRINTYCYMVVKAGNGLPLHIVEISHHYLWAFSVFSTAAAAREYIGKEKERLYNYSGESLDYNADYAFSKNLVKAYKEATAGLFSDINTKQLYINPKLAADFDYCSKWAFDAAAR